MGQENRYDAKYKWLLHDAEILVQQPFKQAPSYP